MAYVATTEMTNVGRETSFCQISLKLSPSSSRSEKDKQETAVLIYEDEDDDDDDERTTVLCGCMRTYMRIICTYLREIKILYRGVAGTHTYMYVQTESRTYSTPSLLPELRNILNEWQSRRSEILWVMWL